MIFLQPKQVHKCRKSQAVDLEAVEAIRSLRLAKTRDIRDYQRHDWGRLTSTT
jgi:hypothetical protein